MALHQLQSSQPPNMPPSAIQSQGKNAMSVPNRTPTPGMAPNARPPSVGGMNQLPVTQKSQPVSSVFFIIASGYFILNNDMFHIQWNLG